MPVFTFKGTDAQGKKISGEKLADSKVQLTMQLRRERITPGAIKEKGKEFTLTMLGGQEVKLPLASVANLLNEKYYSYGIVNTFNCPTFCAYPQAGATAFVSAQYRFP